MSPTPPAWAETLLRAFLSAGDFETVSGDLLEEYRDTVHPARGRLGADAWYVRQVLGFITRIARVWAGLLSAAFLARTALDWRLPPHDFHLRSTVSTLIGFGLLFGAGAWASRRAGSLVAGTAAGVAAAGMAAVASLAGALVLLVLWHDPATLAAIRASGGLGEAFTLPLLTVVPGAVLGTLGGVAGVALSRMRRA
jgi:hypothetical protein